MNKRYRIAFIFAIICIGGASFIFGKLWGIHKSQLVECRKQYQYVNDDVVCGSKDVISKTGYLSTQTEIDNFINAEIASGKIGEAAIYFRDLQHGPTFGINELADFAPASLLKLPLAIVFLNSAERQPELLSVKIRYTGTTAVSGQTYPPSQSAQPNQEYTLDELLQLMISYSDNAAYQALEASIAESPNRQRLRLETFQELGLIDPKDRVEENITVRGYASLFRILYNISYLNPENSEKILGLLAESDFLAGLKRGVPHDISVAHKFGERLYDDGTKQLHDCGIVYYPDNPYLLCVMTKGQDWNELSRVIGSISKMVYEEVDSRRIE